MIIVVEISACAYIAQTLSLHSCDCAEQLKMALEYIQKNGGLIIYLQQEGRGIGLANKVAAYSLQDGGMDTVDANIHLGFPEDCRQYGVVPNILEDMKISSIQLLTNNPRSYHRGTDYMQLFSFILSFLSFCFIFSLKNLIKYLSLERACNANQGVKKT